MANANPELVVEGPARVAAPYGLFSLSGLFRETGDDTHWEGSGITFQSFDGSVDLGTVGIIQADPTETAGIAKAFNDNHDLDHAGVFTVYGQQVMTPVVWGEDKIKARALGLLLGLEERTVEAALWGSVATLDPNFSDATPFYTADSVTIAVAKLESFLAREYGSKGVIHLSRFNATLGLQKGVLETRNGGLFSKLGTPVVAGSGYEDDLAYATSALVAYRSEPFTNSSRAYDLLDKGTNDLYAIAERTYCIGFEEKALGAVEIITEDSPA